MAVPEVIAILKEMEDLHLKKSAGYGSDQDPLHNFNAVAKTAGTKNYYYPILRCIEKLTRAANLLDAGRDDELEEEFKDVALLMVLAEAMRRQTKKAPTLVKPTIKLHVGTTSPADIDRLVGTIVNRDQKTLDFIESDAGKAWTAKYRGAFEELDRIITDAAPVIEEGKPFISDGKLVPKQVYDKDQKRWVENPNGYTLDEWKDKYKPTPETVKAVGATFPHKGKSISQVMVDKLLAPTVREARTLIECGNVYIDGTKIFADGYVKEEDKLLRKGERQEINLHE